MGAMDILPSQRIGCTVLLETVLVNTQGDVGTGVPQDLRYPELGSLSGAVQDCSLDAMIHSKRTSTTDGVETGTEPLY